MMKKRLTAVLLTASVLFGMLPGAAFAQETPVEEAAVLESQESVTGKEPELESGLQEESGETQDVEAGDTMEVVPEEVQAPLPPTDQEETGTPEDTTPEEETDAPGTEDGDHEGETSMEVLPEEVQAPSLSTDRESEEPEAETGKTVPAEEPVDELEMAVFDLRSGEAAAQVVKADGTVEEYATLPEAVSHSATDDRVELLENVALSSPLTLDRRLTLDLNGKRISNSGTLSALLLVEGNVTIEDSAGGGQAVNSGEGCAVQLAATGVTLSVTGGTFYSYQGWAVKVTAGALDMTGGEVFGTVGGIYAGALHNELAVRVTGGSVSGGTGIEIRAGELTVGGDAAVTATGSSFSYGSGDKGPITSGAAVAIAPYSSNKDIKVTVTGGTLTGAKALHEGNPAGADPNARVELSVEDGVFRGEISASDVEHFISGGEFDRELDSELVVEGSQCHQDGDRWIIGPAGESVAAVGSRGFGTLRAAVNAAGDGETVTVLREITLPREGLVIEKRIVLDLNGHTVDVPDFAGGEYGAVCVKNSGELRVTDGSQEKNGVLRATAEPDGHWALVGVEKGGRFDLEAGTLEAAAGAALSLQGGAQAHLTGGGIAVESGSGVEIAGGGEGRAVVRFSGADVTAPETGEAAAVAAVSESGLAWTADVEIGGGRFTGAFRGADPENMDSFYAGINITGGAFTADVDRFIKDPLLGQPRGTGLRAVGRRTEDSIGNVARVLGQNTVGYYGQVGAAVEAAPAGAVVELLADGEWLCGTAEETLAVRKSLTIDGQGHRLTVDRGGIELLGGEDEAREAALTLRDITVVNGQEPGRVVSTGNGFVRLTLDNAALEAAGLGAQTLTIGGTREGRAQVHIGNGSRVLAGEAGSGIAALCPADVTIDHSQVSGLAAVAVRGREVRVEIRDSELTARSAEGAARIILLTTEESETAADALVTITGDSVVRMEGENAALVNAEGLALEQNEGAGLAVSGGSFNREVLQEYCAQGYVPVDHGNGTYGVTNTLAIAADRTSLSGGGRVTLTVTPAGVRGGVSVSCDNGIAVSGGEGGVYTAELPNGDAVYTFTAAAAGLSASCGVSVMRYTSGGGSSGGGASGGGSTSGGGSSQPAQPTQPDQPEEDLGEEDVPLADLPIWFTDVKESDWYYTAVEYMTKSGLMEGMTKDTFAPGLEISRAMIVTVLYRLAGEPEVEITPMSDVDGEQWYAKAVSWAIANGILTGYENGLFLPDRKITREEMVTVMYRFGKAMGYELDANGDLSAFTDRESVSGWAVESMRWAVGANLIVGRGHNLLAPAGTTTRGEAVTIFARFDQAYTGVGKEPAALPEQKSEETGSDDKKED